jgi:hypothetical protein
VSLYTTDKASLVLLFAINSHPFQNLRYNSGSNHISLAELHTFLNFHIGDIQSDTEIRSFSESVIHKFSCFFNVFATNSGISPLSSLGFTFFHSFLISKILLVQLSVSIKSDKSTIPSTRDATSIASSSVS